MLSEGEKYSKISNVYKVNLLCEMQAYWSYEHLEASYEGLLTCHISKSQKPFNPQRQKQINCSTACFEFSTQLIKD